MTAIKGSETIIISLATAENLLKLFSQMARIDLSPRAILPRYLITRMVDLDVADDIDMIRKAIEESSFYFGGKYYDDQD